jgi:thymidine kinase
MDRRGENSSNAVYTHNGQIPVNNIRRAERLMDLYNELNSHEIDVLCIDEGQFFPDLALVVNLILLNHQRKVVIVAALNGSYRQQTFPQVCTLLPMAESVQWICAVCFICGDKKAQFTRRLGEPPWDGSSSNDILVSVFYV